MPTEPLIGRRSGAVMLALALSIAPATVATAQTDSGAVQTEPLSVDPLFVPEDALFAGVMIAGTFAITPLDKKIADFLQGDPQTNRFLRKVSRVVESIAQPGAYIIGGGLYGIGRLADNERMADLGLHGSEAIIFGLAITTVIKYGAGRARPYVDREHPHDFGFMRGWKQQQYRSFPSGHTLVGFAAAAAVTNETRRWWPGSTWYVAPVMYGGATLIGLSRMYDNKHWASDVMIGALIGTFSGLKVVKYHHSHPNNRLDRWLLSVSRANDGEMRLAILPMRP